DDRLALGPRLLLGLEVGVEGLAAAAGLLGMGVGEAEAPTPVAVLVVEDGPGDHRQTVLLDQDAQVRGGLEDDVVLVGLVELEVHLEALAAPQADVDAKIVVGPLLLGAEA